MFFEALFFQKSHSPCREKENISEENVAHSLSLQRAKRGPHIDLQHVYVYIYIYIYIDAVVLCMYVCLYVCMAFMDFMFFVKGE